MRLNIILSTLFILFSFCSFAQNEKDSIPSKEELMQSILDMDVSEEEAIELLAKYYPEMLNPVVEAAKDFDEAQSVQDINDEGLYYQNTGRKFLEKKDYDQAIIYFKKSIVVQKKSQGGSEKHIQISSTYKDLGKAYEAKEEVGEALQFYQRGLISNATDFDDTHLLQNPKAKDLISNSLAIPILEAKGNLLYNSSNDENKLLAALMAYERAIEILDLLCKKYTNETTQLQLTQQITAISEAAIQTALKLYKATRNQKYKNRIFPIVEKGKAMILTSTLLASKANKNSGLPEPMLKTEQSLKTRIAQVSQKIKRGDAKSVKKAEQQLFDLSQQLFFLQDSIKTYYPQHEYLKYLPPTIAMDSLQQFLGRENAAVIEYFFGSKYTFVFTLTGRGLHINKLEDRKQLQRSVLTLREDIQSQYFKTDAEASFKTFTSNANLIYSLCMEAPLAHLRPDIKELIIIPDGPLWLLPFELLLYDPIKNTDINFSPDALPYLLNRYTINYAHSSKMLYKNWRLHEDSSDLPFLGFAPEFSGEVVASKSCFSDRVSLSKLAFNQEELKNIASHFEGQSLFGFEASRKTFLSAAPQAEIIHLSTHACLNKEAPMDSRIFFSNDEYINTEEIYALNMKAKMAVLSACQTGLGQVYNGEGVISLARAFAKAGCPSVTMSLWPVADEATATIMTVYYQQLNKGLSKSEALRKAKLNYLEDQPRAKQHPYYWAAFVHLGEDVPITKSGGSGMKFWLLIGGGLLLFGFFLIKRR